MVLSTDRDLLIQLQRALCERNQMRGTAGHKGATEWTLYCLTTATEPCSWEERILLQDGEKVVFITRCLFC